MNKFIPIVIEPYPDELLYSWIIRLAKVNELSNRLFLETYLNEKDLKKRPVKIDIRRGYQEFYKSLNIDEDMMKLYFQTTTAQFELSFSYKRQQIKILHNILRKEDDLNYISNYFFDEPKVCLECIKEDIKQYGEPYLHRSHQLSGVVACHKHHTPLYLLNKTKDSIHDYDFKNVVNKVSYIKDFDCKYADYTYQLLINNICSNSEDILSIISNAIKEKTGKESFYGQPLVRFIANIIYDNENEISNRKTNLTTQEFIKALIFLFPDVNDFLNKLSPYDMVIKKHCSICNCDYYAVPQEIIDGWGCQYCDDNIDKNKLLKRLVKNIGQNELEFQRISPGKTRKLVLYHKTTNREFTTSFSNFLFGSAKHYGSLVVSRKEAERRVSKHKHFKLIEYSGISKPAKIYHDVCGQVFEISQLDYFTSKPGCRYCEIINEFDFDIFKQRLKDVVGDEYEAIDYTRETSGNLVNVFIKHNKCGNIQSYQPSRFLTGDRCHNCGFLIRKDYLEKMLKKYSDNRYVIVGDVDKQRVTILDTITNNEMVLKLQHVVQEILRPTSSPLFEFNNKERKQISSWDTWYELCKEYRKEFGHLCPKRGEWYKGKLFSRWCEEKRQHYNKGLLTEQQIQQLQELDFVFDAVFYKWNKRFEEYKEYVAETGILLPKKDVVYKGNKLGAWVRSQRAEYKNGNLNPVYEKLLLEFNPKFFDELSKDKQ